MTGRGEGGGGGGGWWFFWFGRGRGGGGAYDPYAAAAEAATLESVPVPAPGASIEAVVAAVRDTHTTPEQLSAAFAADLVPRGEVSRSRARAACIASGWRPTVWIHSRALAEQLGVSWRTARRRVAAAVTAAGGSYDPARKAWRLERRLISPPAGQYPWVGLAVGTGT